MGPNIKLVPEESELFRGNSSCEEVRDESDKANPVEIVKQRLSLLEELEAECLVKL